MKSIAPAAATEQKIDCIVLSDRNVRTKSAGILSENGGEASPGVTDLASVDGIKMYVYPNTSGAFCARTAAGRPTEISETDRIPQECLSAKTIVKKFASYAHANAKHKHASAVSNVSSLVSTPNSTSPFCRAPPIAFGKKAWRARSKMRAYQLPRARAASMVL
jgi:hypothetical protein